MRTLDTDTTHWSSRPLLVAGAGIVAVAVAIGLNYSRGPDETAPSGVIAGGTVTPSGSAALGEGTNPQPPSPQRPSFDIARIGATGDTVIAGRAAPGATVSIQSNGAVIGEAVADHRGEWVFVPEAPLSTGAHRLTLEVRQPDGSALASDGEVLIVVPEQKPDGITVTSRPLAILIPSRDDAATTVLQTPDGGGTVTAVEVDLVDYDALGHLTVGGRGVPGTTVRVTIDTRPIGEATVNANGQWTLAPRSVDLSGNHTLRAEELDHGGRVVAHFEGQLRLAPPSPNEIATKGMIVVQRGDNLWQIARNRYGQGYAYTIIFEANRSRINDPDIIYPGQVFKLPAPERRSPAP